MAVVNGTAGKDFIHVSGDGNTPPGGYLDNPGATNNDDTINIFQGGNDIVFAGGGNDTINLGAAFTANDQINGDIGTDTVNLDGDYSAGLVFGAATMINVENLVLAGGNSYTLKVNEATTGSHLQFNVDGSALGRNDVLDFDGRNETNGTLVITGGRGKDIIKGGSWQNGYVLTAGGNDKATGTIAADGFFMGGAFTAKDQLNGGGGIFDTIYLDGDYSAGVVFGAKTVLSVANLEMATGHDYTLNLNEATVAAGGSMNFKAGSLGVGDQLIFDGSADTDSFSISITGGAGDDIVTGGHANVITMTSGGNDTVTGGAGGDQFNFNLAFTSADKVDGGGGADLLIIGSVNPTVFNLGSSIVKNIETLQITGGNHTITALDNLVAAGASIVIQGQGYGGNATLSFDGSAETNGTYDLRGAGGADTLTGGTGNDILKGFNGKDLLTGGAGADTFQYGTNLAAESTGAACDVITGFDFTADKFDLIPAVSHIDTKITAGTLSTASFDGDMQAVMGGLAAGDAVIFVPSAGTLVGRTFLVVEGNSTTGYQAGLDYVMELNGTVSLNSIDTTDFI